MLKCVGPRHRDLLRLVVLLAVTNALVLAATPAVPPPPSLSPHRPHHWRSAFCGTRDPVRDLDPAPAGRGSGPADCVPGAGSAMPCGRTADPGGRPRRTRRGRRGPGARRRGSRGGRHRDRQPAAGGGVSLTVGLLNIQSVKPKLLELSDGVMRPERRAVRATHGCSVVFSLFLEI